MIINGWEVNSERFAHYAGHVYVNYTNTALKL